MVLLDKEIEKIRIKGGEVINLLIILMQTYKDALRISDIEAAAVMLIKVMEEMVHNKIWQYRY
jgi:lauroyl/myristoyl acyltransferase